jgi:oxidoreductase
MEATKAKRAIVFGSTGASGRALVAELAHNGWDVTAVARREIEDIQATFPALTESFDKVSAAVVDYEALESHADKFAGHDAAFCVLGTTHGEAGSRDAFDRVDRVYVSEAARLSKAADIPVFVLMTAQGTRDYIPRWLSSYTWSKAQAEKAVLGLQFPHTFIIRPGMLDREDKARPIEKFISRIVSGISMQTLAVAMRKKATEFLDGKDTEPTVILEGNGAIEEYARRSD